MESLKWPPNALNQRADYRIKPLHMSLQAGVPGPAACPASSSLSRPVLVWLCQKLEFEFDYRLITI